MLCRCVLDGWGERTSSLMAHGGHGFFQSSRHFSKKNKKSSLDMSPNGSAERVQGETEIRKTVSRQVADLFFTTSGHVGLQKKLFV